MKASDTERLRALRIFADMDGDRFDTLTSTAMLQTFPASTVLLTESDTVGFLYVLLQGAVEMRGSWREKETTVAVARPLSLFILSSVILDSPALISVHTLERSEVLMIPAASIRSAMRGDIAFAVAVAEEMAGWNRAMVRHVKDMKLRSAIERLANYLIKLQVQQGGAETVRLPHEKRVLASLLGMTPENLSRAFAGLGDRGVIVNGSEVSLTTPEPLLRLARPSPLIDNHLPPADHLCGKAERELWPPRHHDKVIFD